MSKTGASGKLSEGGLKRRRDNDIQDGDGQLAMQPTGVEGIFHWTDPQDAQSSPYDLTPNRV